MTQAAREIPVTSSLIRSVTYGTDATLTLRFHSGAVYRYFTVPRTTIEAFLAATSKGAYFNRHIRDCFPYRRIAGSPSPE
jgi:hypothetical protein